MVNIWIWKTLRNYFENWKNGQYWIVLIPVRESKTHSLTSICFLHLFCIISSIFANVVRSKRGAVKKELKHTKTFITFQPQNFFNLLWLNTNGENNMYITNGNFMIVSIKFYMWFYSIDWNLWFHQNRIE